MGIKKKGYAHWEGELQSRRLSWSPITRLGIGMTFKKKYFKFVFFMALFPTLVFLALVYISERLDEFDFMIRETKNLISVDPGFFAQFLSNNYLLFMMVMILVFAGAGLIADDLKHNAVQLYFSRPITKRDYFIGKLSILSFFFMMTTLAPSLLLVLMKLVFSGDMSFLGSYPNILFSIAGYALLLILFFSCYGLFLSSMSKNRRYVAILIFGFYFGSDVLYGIFFGIFRSPYFNLLSIKNNLKQIASGLFGTPVVFAVPWGYSLLIIGLFCLISSWFVIRRIQTIEVVR